MHRFCKQFRIRSRCKKAIDIKAKICRGSVAMSDKELVEELKSKLLKTKKQMARRNIIAEYEDKIVDYEQRIRLERFKEKANMKKPKYIIGWWIGLYGYIPAWILCFAIAFGTDVLSTDAEMTLLNTMWLLIGGIASCWCLIGIPALLVWGIVNFILKKRDGYYLNISNI